MSQNEVTEPVASASPLVLLRSLLDSLGFWLLKMRMRHFLPLILAIGIIRIGPLGIGPTFIEALRVSAASFPVPSTYVSSGLGPTIIISVIGSPPDAVWWVVGSLVWIGTVIGLVFAIKKSGAWQKPTWILVVMSPAFILSVSMLGQTDMFTIAGSLLIACGRRPLTLIAGILIVPLGNPEQAFASSVILLLVALALRERVLLRRSLTFVTFAAVYLLGIQIWYLLTTESDGRAQLVLGENSVVVNTTRYFLGTWPLAFYAAMGPLWIVFLVVMRTLKARARWIIFFAIVVIPIGIVTITIDGTRDFVMPGLAGTAALFIITWRRNWKGSLPSNVLVGTMFLLLILSPALIIDSMGTIRMPYDDWLTEGFEWSRLRR